MQKYTYSFYLPPPKKKKKTKKKKQKTKNKTIKKKCDSFLNAFRVPAFRFITVECSAGLISNQWGELLYKHLVYTQL